MIKMKARISREMPDVKDKLQWKEDVCKYSESAFEEHKEDYETIANCIYKLLETHYEANRWVVFVYELPGDTLVYYQYGYCCTIECVDMVTGKKYYVALKCYPNNSFISRKLYLGGEECKTGSIKVLEKGEVNEQDIISCFSSLVKADTVELDVEQIVNSFSSKAGDYNLGMDWGVSKCRKGAIATNLKDNQYLLFQLGDFIYLCFRQL